MARDLTSDILASIEQDDYLIDTSDDDDEEEDNSDDNISLDEIIKELESDLGVTENDSESDEEEVLKEYTVLATRNLETAWTYTVKAHNDDEAIEMVENCPDGYCDEVTHNDDENVYTDDINYEINDVKDIEPPKPVAKKAVQIGRAHV